MLETMTGFQTRAKGIYCMIHRYAFASKTSLNEVLDFLIKNVNYVEARALDTRLFKEFCKGMNANHEVLLFYTAVC